MNEKEMRDIVEKQLPYAVESVSIPELGAPKKGKVRDIYRLPGGYILIVTTDRLSAFDHVLCTEPYKGSVLNGICGYWFNEIKDVAPTAFQGMIGAMVMVMKDVKVLPYEAIVREYITGSAAREYFSEGRKIKCGIDLSKYLREGRKNERFTELLFTPTTKAESGHDEDIN
jgi:phosphoribosylaminoimidazole-succinocarboxamide synthase